MVVDMLLGSTIISVIFFIFHRPTPDPDKTSAEKLGYYLGYFFSVYLLSAFVMSLIGLLFYIVHQTMKV